MGTTPCLPAKALPPSKDAELPLSKDLSKEALSLSKDEDGQKPMHNSLSKDEDGQMSMQKSLSKDEDGQMSMQKSLSKDDGSPAQKNVEEKDPLLDMLEPPSQQQEAAELVAVAKVVASSRIATQQEPMKVGDVAKVVATGKVGTVWAIHPDDRLYHCKLNFKDGVLPPVHWYSKDAVALVKSVAKQTEDTTISKDTTAEASTGEASQSLVACALHSLSANSQAVLGSAAATMAHLYAEVSETLHVAHTDKHTDQRTSLQPPPLPPPEEPPVGGEQARLEQELGLQRAMLQANLGRSHAAQAMEVAQLEEVLQKACGRASQRSQIESDLERQRAAQAAECQRIEDELQEAQAQAARRDLREAELERKMQTEEPAKLHAELRYVQAETEEYKCKLACEMKGLKRQNEKSRAEHLRMVEELQRRLEEERGIANLIRERDQLLEREGNAQAMHLLQGRLDEIGAEGNALRKLVDDLQKKLTEAESQKGTTLEEQDKMRQELEEAMKAQDVLRKARDEFEQKLAEVRERQPKCGPFREGQPQCTACTMM